MDLRNSVALVTGANRGLGRHLAAGLLARGARTVYAAARNPDSVDLPGAVPLRLDITDPESVAAAAATAGDVTVLVNNAGSLTGANLLDGDLADIRLDMETHYFGTLAMIRAFAPVIAANGGGALLNVLSVKSWLHFADTGAYDAGKAAGWALTNSVRQQLLPRGITTTGLYVGYMDTGMAARLDVVKSDPAVIAARALDGVADGAPEVLADDVTRTVRSALSSDLSALYPQLAG